MKSSTETMLRQVTQVLVVLSIGLIAAGCVAPVTPVPDPGSVVECEARQCSECPATPPSQGVGEVWVLLHVMQAKALVGFDFQDRKDQYVERWAWQLAKTDDAAWDFWSSRIDFRSSRIDEYFGRVGKVTKIWEKQQIHLRLLRVEHCTYEPEYLRLDGRPRDSMFTPESQVPWAPQLFRSINRLFTMSEPNVIHVFLWWSVQEGDAEGPTVKGYSRSAAHGGPAVWADAYGCATLETLPDERCALLLAHEIGHALGLQHVDDASNLMNFGYTHADLTKEQGDRARLEARQQFIRAR